jgi:hypothetical protein
MSFWVELHCDIRLGHGNQFDDVACHTQRGDLLGMLVSGASHVRFTPSALRTEAIRKGWKKSRLGWACPNCQATEPSDAP